MRERPTVYHIPTNYTDAGRVLGFFELRNVIEAAVCALPMLGICFAMARILPFSITVKLAISLCLLVPVCGFALIGIRDDSLTRFICTYFRYRKNRRILINKGETIPYEHKRSHFRQSAGRNRAASGKQ